MEKLRDTVSEGLVWSILNNIPDPEIPVISIVELGVVRKIEITDEVILITITPTYSGCPAIDRFVSDIKDSFKRHAIPVDIKFIYSPAWTTDWITDEAKEKLERYGIAPPVSNSQDKGFLFQGGPKQVRCPQCKSTNTKLVSQFGSTACKALYSCNDCLEPFDYFKCI